MSTIQNTARNKITARIKDQWRDARNKERTKVLWPGTSLAVLEKGPIDRDKGYIVLTIQFGTSVIGTKNGRNTMSGTLIVQFFMPRYKGEADLLIKADHMRDIFNRVEFSGIRFDSPSGAFNIAAPDSAWLQATMDAPFTVDETGVTGTIE